jgi:exopolysaccharide production protein ExoZ
MVIEMRTEITSLQVLRAIAALAVSLSHLQNEFLRNDMNFSKLFLAGQAGVDLFFVISGFIIIYVSESLFGSGGRRYFLFRRLARIVPLYWSISGFMLVYFLLIYGGLQNVDLSIKSTVGSFIFFPTPRPSGSTLPVLTVGWTLILEILFYCMICLLLPLKRAQVVIVGSIIFVGIAAFNVLAQPSSQPVATWSDPIIAEFTFGMFIALAYRAGWKIPSWVSTLLVVGAATAIIIPTFIGYDPGLRPIAYGIPAALIVAGATLSRATLRPSPLVAFAVLLGDSSYALYLTHPIVHTLPRRLFSTFMNPKGYPVSYGCLLIALSIAVAIAVHLLFERPVTKWLQARIGSRPALATAPRGVVVP